MAITLMTGPANAGKAQVVMDAVRRHLAHGEEPLLVVPTRADAEHYLRELAGDGAAMGVSVVRFEGLIEEAVRRAAVTEPVLGGLARERVLAAIAGRSSLGRDGGGPAPPGLVRALAGFIAELQVRRVTPARLSRALEDWTAADGAGATRGELAGLFEEYQRTLEQIGRLDVEQRAVRALDALRQRPALWGRTPLLFHGFDDLTRLQIDAIETLGRVVGATVTVSLTYEPGRTAFAGRAATFAGACSARGRAPRACGARGALCAQRARRAEPSRALAVRARRRAGGSRGEPYACWRAAASAPSSSW